MGPIDAHFSADCRPACDRSGDRPAHGRKLLTDRPYGIGGWSGGSAMTQNALFRYPELYKTGIAAAGPTDSNRKRSTGTMRLPCTNQRCQ
jgi:hypothetical protein